MKRLICVLLIVLLSVTQAFAVGVKFTGKSSLEVTDITDADVSWPADKGGTGYKILAGQFATFVTNKFDASSELLAIMDDEVGTGYLVFNTAPTFVTSIAPTSADGASLGTTALEWQDLYLADGGVIYGQADQSATLTSSASLWTANNFSVTAQFKLPSDDNDPTATAGYLRHDITVTNHANGAVRWHDGTNIRQMVDIVAATIEAATDDQVVAYDADNDLFYLKADADSGGATAINAIGDAAADGTIDQTGYKQTWTSTLNSAGSVWTFTNTTADLTADVSFLDFKYTDDGDANGFFLRGYDNSGGDLKWSIGLDGALVSGAHTPNAADAGALGSAAAEWSDLFLADGAVINFGNDQDVTITHVPDVGIQVNTAVRAAGVVTGLMPSVVLTIASGVHDGSDDQAIMTDSGESFTTSQFVGMTLYNITDGSACTVTANDGTTITCTLAGGTGNDWDTSDVWQVGPGPYQSGSWFYVVGASTIRHPATAGYIACYESDAAAVLTVDMASASMIFQGVLDSAVTALDAGDSIDSSGSTTGDYQCLHNKSVTEAQGKGKRGIWVDGGAS